MLYIIITYTYSITLYYINYLGRRNRTLHLYVVTATNLGLRSFRSRANAETSHSVRVGLVVVVSVGAVVKKFLHGIVRSQKPLLMVPLYNNSYYTVPY